MKSAVGFKLTAPAIREAIDRDRVLARLRAVPAAAKWVCGPSGCGKSTLVAQYAGSGDRKLVWYRLDARDDDPAFFYAGIAGAFAAAGADVTALPRCADEDRPAESAFASRFFATALKALASACTLVLDDAHTVSTPHGRRTLECLASLATEAQEVVFVSEEPPPDEFFDLVAARRMSLCNDLPLDFDVEECAALGRTLRLASADGHALRKLTGGHAGALVLACEYLRGGDDSDPRTDAVIERIHQHLLDRLLERMPDSRRKVLTRTAFAPRFSVALATALAGEHAAAEIDGLEARGLLRRVTSQEGVAFEAHRLVRLGVRASLRAREGEAGVRALALETAEQLLAHQCAEDAFPLFVEHGATARAADVLETLAPAYARAGQAELLTRAIERLPEDELAMRPWLCFWTGRALLGIDEERARRWFERSYTAFAARGNRAGMRLSSACVLIAFNLEYGDIRTLDAWIARHEQAGGNEPVPPGAEYEPALCLGVISAALVAGSHAPGTDAQAIVRRLQVLIGEPDAWLTSDQPVEAARLLMDHARIFGPHEQGHSLTISTRAIADDPSCGALQRGRWHISAALALARCGQLDAAAEHLELARTQVEATRSARLAFEFAMAGFDVALTGADLAAAEACLKAIEPDIANAPPAQRADYGRATARVLLGRGKWREGLRWAEEALQTATLAGYSGAHTRAFLIECISGLAANTRYEEAAQRAEGLTRELDGNQRTAILAVMQCLRFLAGGSRNLDLLREGLRNAADIAFVRLLARGGEALPQLCMTALEHNIQPDFVRSAIRVNRLRAPRGAGPTWPWPVRVRTLGGFELEVAGKRYRPGHKAQDKPLELLKLLICCQAMGRDSADKDWIGERLWPDADVANARKSLDMTVSRLRRLLKDEDALQSLERRLQLSPAHVWTDVGPLLRALSLASEHRDARQSGRAGSRAASTDIAAVFAHYRGPFLPDEQDLPWIIAGREAIKTAVRSALLTADLLLAGRDDVPLVGALELALAADPTSEDLARALMRALLRGGQLGEALRVYRRLRDMLSIVLGVKPTRETEQLRESIHAAAPAGSVASDAALP